MFLQSQTRFIAAIVKMHRILLLIIYFAVCATLSSFLNDVPFESIVNQLVEIHFQAIVSLIAFHVICSYLGPSRFYVYFSIPIAISVAIAAMQFLGFTPAWSLYDVVASVQPQSTEELEFHDPHYRALGLSYSPVHLGTQISLVFALFFGVLARQIGKHSLFRRLGQRRVFAAVLLFVVAALVSGNRSPLLGIICFLGVYLFLSRPILATLFVCLIPAFILLQPLVVDILNSTGVRAFNTENSSGEGRAALRAFGTMLFIDRPFGYGLTFESTQYWWRYWKEIQGYENPEAITLHALHNFYLVTLNKHGILMLLPLYWVFRKIVRNATSLLGFIPYAIHCFYHNSGPTNGDFMFWFIIPVFSIYALGGSQRVQTNPDRVIHTRRFGYPQNSSGP
ncbi:O-antigen ligase family protein [Rhizobium sp. XQZ8]|uniref:O-antigen ligase family protein n=1 Tax=Rhizobium populisoli TaxID=2859785 RepID=UPI001CA5F076|nr:O-antigen ligase family protein [Rhizobium populisoli]MBW6426029.1 O-antigen ligase family protein [Rhizobium populisoli]